MNFNFDESQKEYRKKIKDFITPLSCENIDELDRDGKFNRELWDRFADFGIQGGLIPLEYGGEGLNLMTFMSGLEVLGQLCRDSGLLFSLCAHIFACVLTIVKYGSDRQKRYWLPKLGKGGQIAAIAIAEEHGASNAFNIVTTALQKDDGYILNGRKIYITNSAFCDLALVFTKLENTGNIICLLVEKDNPGMVRAEAVEKLGMRTSPFGELIFNNCFVPKENLLGKADSGKMIFMSAMEWERGCILGPTVGVMERQINHCIEYVQNRKQGDHSLSEHQSLRHRIVDMKMRIELSRLMLYQFAWEKQIRRRANLHASMAKLYISEAVLKNSLDAMQIQGAYGYTSKSEVEREVRDSLAFRIASGTSDIQKNIIAKWLQL